MACGRFIRNTLLLWILLPNYGSGASTSSTLSCFSVTDKQCDSQIVDLLNMVNRLVSLQNYDSAKKVLDRIPEDKQVDCIAAGYENHLKNVEYGCDFSGYMHMLDSTTLELVLEKELTKTGIITVNHLFYFSQTDTNGFIDRASMDSVALKEKRPCAISMWRAVYIFKNEDFPGKARPDISCPIIDKYIEKNSAIDAERLIEVYEHYNFQ